MRARKKSSRQSKRRRRCWETRLQFVASSYVCPEIINSFEKGQVIDNCSSKLEDLIAYRGRGLHDAEQSLLKFLKRGGG